MKEYICAYCGKNTYDVDIEYLVGFNHLSCVLMDQLAESLEKEKKMNKKKPVEISNWDKLVGNKFDVMGASFIIMDSGVDSIDNGSNAYTAWVHATDDNEPFVRVTLFADNMDMQVKVVPPLDYNGNMTPYDLTSTITKNHISNPSIFIQTIAEALLSDSTTRDLLLYVSRKQDDKRRFKGRGYTQLTGTNGSSGNTIW
jgi:hypothetical protein